jgi:hypothetical protein
VLFNPFSLKYFSEHIDSKFYKKNFLFGNDYSIIKGHGENINSDEINSLKDSNVEWKNLDFDTNYYPYYGMLSDNEKVVYKQVYANAEKVTSTFKPAVDIYIDGVKNVLEAIYDDHPELFWLDTSYSYKYTDDDKVVQIELNFNKTVNDLEKHKKIFTAAANKIINKAKKLDGDYAKEKYVYDKLVSSIEYDKDSEINQSAYSALVNKKTICAGYTRAFQYILIKLSIPTYYVVGIADVTHAWNMVKLDNEYYNVDLTWGISNSSRYKYFNRTDSYYSSNHTRTGLSIDLPECDGKKYMYKSKRKW